MIADRPHSDDCIATLLARHGVRATPQRVRIYDALRSTRSHPTAEELFSLVRPGLESLSLATIYNTLEVLARVGLIRRLATTNGCCRYDADTTPHSHVRFSDSGEIADLPETLDRAVRLGLAPEVLASIEQQLGVRIENLSIQIVARRS